MVNEDSWRVQRDTVKKCLKMAADQYEADAYFINAQMTPEATDSLMREIEDNKQCGNCVLFLTTDGGYPHAAFRMANAIRLFYPKGKFILFVLGRCKSAGTLVAVGADEIVMGAFGEFGPLDAQLPKKDNVHWRQSGLNTVECFKKLNDELTSCFWKSFYSLLQKSGGIITTSTAADIASKLSIGLFAPVSRKIDAIEFVDVQRATEEILDYALRLTKTTARPLRDEKIRHFIHGYRSHGFAIDFSEAIQIFSSPVKFLPIEYKDLEYYCYDIVRKSISPYRIVEYVASHGKNN